MIENGAITVIFEDSVKILMRTARGLPCNFESNWAHQTETVAIGKGFLSLTMRPEWKSCLKWKTI